jgi:hypothetical protein
MLFILLAFSALSVLVEGPDDHGSYGHCAKKAEGEESVEEDQVWAFGLGLVFFVGGRGWVTHI